MDQLPWLLALITAFWFGAMARRARQNWFLWAVGGALFALASSTIILGLREAAFVALSHEADVQFQTRSVTSAVGVVGGWGWLFTLSLQRWHRRFWKRNY
jgi:hypothetical protein